MGMPYSPLDLHLRGILDSILSTSHTDVLIQTLGLSLHIVGKVLCLPLLCLIDARRDGVCPLYGTCLIRKWDQFKRWIHAYLRQFERWIHISWSLQPFQGTYWEHISMSSPKDQPSSKTLTQKKANGIKAEYILYNLKGEYMEQKTTAPRIPMWSPTMVLAGRHPG